MTLITNQKTELKNDWRETV